MYYPVGTKKKHHPYVEDADGNPLSFRDFLRYVRMARTYGYIKGIESELGARVLSYKKKGLGNVLVLRKNGVKFKVPEENLWRITEIEIPEPANKVEFVGDSVHAIKEFNNIGVGVIIPLNDEEPSYPVVELRGKVKIVTDRVGEELNKLFRELVKVMPKSYDGYVSRLRKKRMGDVTVYEAGYMPNKLIVGERIFTGVHTKYDELLEKILEMGKDFREKGWTMSFDAPYFVGKFLYPTFRRKVGGFTLEIGKKLGSPVLNEDYSYLKKTSIIASNGEKVGEVPTEVAQRIKWPEDIVTQV